MDIRRSRLPFVMRTVLFAFRRVKSAAVPGPASPLLRLVAEDRSAKVV